MYAVWPAIATRVITRIIKPLCIFIYKNGIRHTIFIDDGKVNAKSREDLVRAFTFVLDTLGKAGFVIAPNKTDTAKEFS